MERQIEYSSERIREGLESALDRMNALRYNEKYKHLLGEGFVAGAKTWDESIRRSQDDPFTVVVVGDFKRGKSTFINALLGEEVVTTDVTTETVTLNRISYGAHSNKGQLSGNRQINLSDKELRKGELEKVSAQLGEPIRSIEMKRPIEILRSMTIIDTPGLGDALHDFSDVVRAALIQADAVIYMFNVMYPLSQSEQLFLKSSVLSQEYTSLFLVGNYADITETEQGLERVRAKVKERISGLLPDTEAFMISGLDELCRRLGKPRPCAALAPVLEAEFAALREGVIRMLEDRSQTVVLDRMQRLASGMTADLGAQLDALEKGLKMSRGDAAKLIDDMKAMQEESISRQRSHTERVSTEIGLMKNEAILWMNEFIERLDSDEASLANVENDVLLKYYEFYCVDMVKDALDACLNVHETRVYDLLDEMSVELGRRLVEGFGVNANCNFRMSLNNRIWTTGDTASMAVPLVVSTMPVLRMFSNVATLVTSGIAGAMRQKEKKTNAPKVIAQIMTQKSGMITAVDESIVKIYESLRENACRLIAEFYEEEIGKSRRLMEQSIHAAGRAQENKDEALGVVAEVRAMLAEIQDVCV